jgi:3-deoxy-D-arabino-heptulosonate 7-phosphate (DAHP) synthase
MGGLSVTDSCLGFVESQKMIEWLYNNI